MILNNGVTLGNLSYEYDAIGRRTKPGGSLAQINLPTALSTTAYNDANHQTTFGSSTLTYDLNGNLTSDGTKTYTWNARNQLTAISGGGVSASFAYDAVGRRKSKTISSTTTSFLYDGANVVQEQVSGSASANLLTGGIDRFFSRTDASGTTTPLVDGLGSVIGLTDASGAIQTQYSYEPFGKSSMSGTTSSNPQKYTGREDDGTGLFYYRARYYSPDTQRFISEDPIGLAGGDINLFAYVGNEPTVLIDPMGTQVRSDRNDGPTSMPTFLPPPLSGRQCKEKNGKVYLCHRVAHIPGNIFKFQHYWIKTDEKEAGLGAEGAGVPGQGAKDCPGVRTTINDHTGECDNPEAECEEIPGADPNWVNQQLQLGQYQGRWCPLFNDCQTFAYRFVPQKPLPKPDGIHKSWGGGGRGW